MTEFKKILAVLAIGIVIAAGLVIALSNAAYSDTACVPSDAWTETVEHPAVTHDETTVVVDQEAYDETVFDHWQRYSWTGGPRAADDAPPFPDENWQENVAGDPHNVGVPGAYFRVNGNSGRGDWFYLEAVESLVHHDAVTHEETVTVVDSEAWTETIEHDAVTCGDNPPECDLTVDPDCDGVIETDPPCVILIGTVPVCPGEEPECTTLLGLTVVCPGDPGTPVIPDEPGVPTHEQSCVGGALVTKDTDADGNISSSVVNGSRKCAQHDKKGKSFKEEGF